VRKWLPGFGVALTLTAALRICLAFTSPGLFWDRYDRIPEPNPPAIERDVPEAPSSATVLSWMAPYALTEWTFHKTSDNLHPDGDEQQLLWLMNRARSDPAQEGIWLATEGDPDIAAARSFWHVDTTVLQNEFAAIPAKPPAAFDVRLYTAAKAHSDYLISIDQQNHTGQFSRIDAAGFEYTSAAGIVYAYSEHTVYGHAGFNIDWGPGTDGTQDPPGHRNAIMSVNQNYTNVGYAVVSESNPSTHVGPQVITGNLCNADQSFPDHYNLFLVGTVWVDVNGNNQYDPEEGIPDVTVMPDNGPYYAITAEGGGYAIPITATGNYQVSFSGPLLKMPVVQNVSVGSDSELLDLNNIGNTLPRAKASEPTSVSTTSAVLNGTVNPYDSGDTAYHFEYGASTSYGNVTATHTAIVFSSVAENISGLSPNTTYHFRLVVTNSMGTHYSSDMSFGEQDPAPSSGGGGGGGCFLTTAATGLGPGALAVLASAVGASAALLALLSLRRAWETSILARRSTRPNRVLKNSA
jgi:hypothetical protein